MANTFAADLSSITAPMLADLFYQGLNLPTVLTQVAKFHDLRGANGSTVRFPVVAPMTAVQAADSVATTFQTVAPSATDATIVELHTAVSLSRFAQDTTPIKSPNDLAASMMSALADGVENLLVDEAVAGPADEVGSDTAALDLATLRSALSLAGPDRGDVDWIINLSAEGDLLSDASLTSAAAYGNPMVIQEGRVGRLYGGDVFMSRWLAANRSALVTDNTLHYGVARAPELDIVYNPSTRSDEAVARCAVAVKYIPQPYRKGVRIRHL